MTRGRCLLVAAGLGAVLTAVLLGPVLLDPNGRLPGTPFVGAYSHVWRTWWTAHAVADLHVLPATTSLLAFPGGFDVGWFMAGFLDAALVVPITRFWGPVAGVNTWIAFTVASGAALAFVLAVRTGLSSGPAALVAVGWTVSPFALSLLHGGSYEVLPGPWPPLVLLGFVEMVRPGGLWPPLAALAVAAGLLLQALASWPAAVTWAGVALVGTVVVALRTPRRTPWAALGLLAGLAASWGASRILLPAPTHLPSPVLDICSLKASEFHFTHLGGPPGTRPLLVSSAHQWRSHFVVLVGLAGAAAALASRSGRLWALALVPFLLDRFLPIPWIPLRTVPGPPEGVCGLAATLLEHVGDRRLLPLYLLLPLAAAHGVQAVARALARQGLPRLGRVIAPVTIAAWLAEGWMAAPHGFPNPSFEVPDAPHARWLATAGPGAVLDLPAMAGANPTAAKAVLSRYLYEQTLHGRPIRAAVGTGLSHDPADVLDAIEFALPWDPEALGLTPRRPPRFHDAALADGWDARPLVEAGFGWLVLHGAFVAPESRAVVAASLEASLGPPEVFPGEVRVWRLDGP
ncbi:MAG: hypothetical protein JXB39_12105 [Deltaproteobacteria bacterium]|nr:hypothetical protein [Deltaproteobacteria bacterium]